MADKDERLEQIGLGMALNSLDDRLKDSPAGFEKLPTVL
jgi:hypothetical protein